MEAHADPSWRRNGASAGMSTFSINADPRSIGHLARQVSGAGGCDRSGPVGVAEREGRDRSDPEGRVSRETSGARGISRSWVATQVLPVVEIAPVAELDKLNDRGCVSRETSVLVCIFTSGSPGRSSRWSKAPVTDLDQRDRRRSVSGETSSASGGLSELGQNEDSAPGALGRAGGGPPVRLEQRENGDRFT